MFLVLKISKLRRKFFSVVEPGPGHPPVIQNRRPVREEIEVSLTN
jgi:hypothetical protein